MGTIDIADILKKRDADKYRDIIVRAANNGYHDFKFDNIPGHPEYGNCICPKAQLVEDLSRFPELKDISRDVISGKYDEQADQLDQQHMRNMLIADDVPDAFFKMLNLAPPTETERRLRRPINN